MTKNHLILQCRLVAALILLAVVCQWKIYPGLYQLYTNGYVPVVIYAPMVLIFTLLNLFAGIGLYKLRTWGFILAYIAIPFSTVFFSASYLLLIGNKPIPLIATNLIVLVYIVYLHRVRYHASI